MPGLREDESPNLDRISSSLKLANENPAKKTRLQLQSADKDGEVDAQLKVEESKVWRLGANIDNSGNSNSGKTHVGLTFQHANVAGRDHVLSLQYTTTVEKPSQVSVYGAGYHIPLYALGDSIDLFGSYSNVDAGSVAAGIFDLQVSGKGSVFGARYNMNVRRAGNFDSKLVLGTDYKQYKNDVLLLDLQLGNDITVYPVSLTYSGNWSETGGDVNFHVTAMHNVAGSSDADFDLARTGAVADYSLVRYGVGASRNVGGWLVRGAANGQYTRDSLIPGEQFGAGGASSVRGFGEREVANDRGYQASAELYTPNFCGAANRANLQCRALVFYDAAHASRNKPLPGELQDVSIASAGIGLRVALDHHLSLQFDYGRVLDAGGMQEKGDHRLHFTLGLSY